MAATILEALLDASRGLYDSLAGLLFILELDSHDDIVRVEQPPPAPVRTVLQKKREIQGVQQRNNEPEPVLRRLRTWQRVLRCMALNIICAVVLHAMLLPLLSFFFHLFMEAKNANSLSISMSYAAVLPLYIFSRIINALWFSDVANACNRALQLPEPRPVDIRRGVSDFIISIVLELIFLAQSLLVAHVPIPFIAPILEYIHLSLLHSLYCFEYFWMSRSVLLNARVSRMERHLPYFVGFGTPLTVSAMLAPNFIVGGALFGALFPLFIISSYKAQATRRGRLPFSDNVPLLKIFMPSQVVTDRFATLFSHWMLPDAL